MVSNDGKTVDYNVTGVFRDMPKNSHFDARHGRCAIDPADLFPQNIRIPDRAGALAERLDLCAAAARHRSPRTIDAQLPAWEKRNIPDDLGDHAEEQSGDYEN